MEEKKEIIERAEETFDFSLIVIFTVIICAMLAGSIGFYWGQKYPLDRFEQVQQQLAETKQQSKQSAMSPREILDNLRVKVWPKEDRKCLVVVKIDDQTELLQCVEIEGGPKPHYESTDKK